jgi:hypothetical protein
LAQHKSYNKRTASKAQPHRSWSSGKNNRYAAQDYAEQNAYENWKHLRMIQGRWFVTNKAGNLRDSAFGSDHKQKIAKLQSYIISRRKLDLGSGDARYDRAIQLLKIQVA